VGRGGLMRQTFKTKFDQLGPERRAGIIFGIDKMHRRFVASNGGISNMPHDVAELLRDEPTIQAYLSIVQREGDPELYIQARVDADRARGRLVGAEAQPVFTA
jgi:hypothetical protein